VTFLGLFRREVDDNELVYAARQVVEAVRSGLSEDDAARQAGVDEETLRGWRRDSVFRHAVRRAKALGPRTNPIVSLDDEYRKMVAAGEGPGSASWADYEVEAREEALAPASADLRRPA
jgi:hypothetical protein